MEYVDTALKFHDRPLPNLSSQEKHRAGIWDDLGAESQRFSWKASTLPIEAGLGSGSCRWVVSWPRDAWRKRETASAAPSPVLASYHRCNASAIRQASLVSFEGRSVGKCSHAQRRTSNGEQARPHQTRPLRQWALPGRGTVNLTRGDQPGLVQRLPVSLQLPVARPTSGRADLYPIRLRARGVW